MLCKWRKAFRCEDLKAHELNLSATVFVFVVTFAVVVVVASIVVAVVLPAMHFGNIYRCRLPSCFAHCAGMTNFCDFQLS